MKITDFVFLSAVVPFFVLMSAISAPPDSVRMTHLRFGAVPDAVGEAGPKETRLLITSRASYDKLFGAQRCTIDFDTEWAFFYSAGWKPSTGYDAEVLDVGYRNDSRTLVFTTQLTSPGKGCVESPMLTKPYSLVKFAVPPGRVDAVRFFADDVVFECR